MRHKNRPYFVLPTHRRRNGLFAFYSIIPNIIIIAVLLGIFYFLSHQGLFPGYIDYIYYGIKIVIALQIIIASARSLLAPIFALLIGFASFFAMQMYHITLMPITDLWQLIGAGIVGAIISILAYMMRQ